MRGELIVFFAYLLILGTVALAKWLMIGGRNDPR